MEILGIGQDSSDLIKVYVSMIDIKVLFFASFKETLGVGELSISVAENATIAELCDELSGNDGPWEKIFGDERASLKVARNQTIKKSKATTLIKRYTGPRIGHLSINGPR